MSKFLRMEKDTETKSAKTIDVLPNEIISMILQNNNCCDILRFGSTCKRFNDMVNCDQCLWKDVCRCTLPAVLFDIIHCHFDGDWLNEIKWVFKLKQNLHSELISMSPQYYWRNSEVTFEDVRNFFMIAMSNNKNYYFTIHILQDVIKKGNKSIDEYKCIKPYTLTEMYYARVALRHLIHTYLAAKWVKGHVKEELTPEIVINFFLQWVDTDNLHSDEDVENRILAVVQKVETLLQSNCQTKSSPFNVQELLAKGVLTERKILEAVTLVLYHHKHMGLQAAAAANLDTLNIVKVLDHKWGNVIVVAAVYQSVARRLGVKCELVAFPNHLFLEWKDNTEPRCPQTFTIDLGSGGLHPKRRCPFSQHSQNSNYKYYPDSLLQYIYSSFHMTMGAIKNWNTQNAMHLLDFLGTYDNEHNPYRNFLSYLLDYTHLPAMSMTLDLKYLSDGHLQILRSLSNLNTPFKTVIKNLVVKKRDRRVEFAVGMICYHKKYRYVCIIRGWDLSCAVEWQKRMEIETLDYGAKQPFYHVIAADQSERYVAQENLTIAVGPNRLQHLEELIAREFTHFNGFAYQPNDEKRMEYPDEGAISDWFRNQCEMKINLPSVSVLTT